MFLACFVYGGGGEGDYEEEYEQKNALMCCSRTITVIGRG